MYQKTVSMESISRRVNEHWKTLTTGTNAFQMNVELSVHKQEGIKSLRNSPSVKKKTLVLGRLSSTIHENYWPYPSRWSQRPFCVQSSLNLLRLSVCPANGVPFKKSFNTRKQKHFQIRLMNNVMSSKYLLHNCFFLQKINGNRKGRKLSEARENDNACIWT